VTQKKVSAGQVKLSIPDRGRVEKSMEAYAKAVREEKRPAQQERFAISDKDRLKRLS
jgi:hypothetical protein